MSKYNVKITKINEDTGEEKELMNENLRGVLILGYCNDDKMIEAGYHVNLFDLAKMIASSKKTRLAAVMAIAMAKAHEDKEDFEESLKDQIEGGNE